MFNFIKKAFGKLTSSAATPANAPARSGKPSGKAPEASKAKSKASAAEVRKDSAAKPPKKKTVKKVVATLPEKPSTLPVRRNVPQKPAELLEIPPCEGKTRFADFDLHPDILFGLQHMTFQYCTPIQAMALRPLLGGNDLAGKAQTGTGKTAAFLIAAFDYLLKKPLPSQKDGQARVLVLAPTRELAMQIHKDAEEIGIFTGLHNLVVFGGMDHDRQRRSLEGPVDILIGTPGRIIDYSRSGSLNLKKVEMLVIDEADRMLDMGFIPDVRRIVGQLPDKENRQTMLFSATLDDSILRLASDWLTDPVMMESEPEKIVCETITQTFYTVSRDEKLPLLLYFLRTHPEERMLIFGNRKDVNLRLARDLERYGYHVPLLSGDIAQEKRIKILERFRAGSDKILIATDVAARGIHVDDVSMVINYDLPERPDDYVHRIGRTGRAGKSGTSISFLCEYGAYNLDGIEKLLSIKFPSILPSEDMLKMPPRDPDYRPSAREDDAPARRSGSGSSSGRRPSFGGRSSSSSSGGRRPFRSGGR